MSRFYIRPDSIKNDRIYVDGREAHHILDVMRLKKGDRIVAFDGTGKEYFGIIEDISKKSLIIKIEEEKESKTKRSYKITLAQAIPKMDKMDYIIQKTTELGIDSIIPMNTERAVVKLKKDKVFLKLRRWGRIAREAAKQCGRNSITAIEDYLNFKEVLDRVKSYDLVLMPSVSPFKKQSLKRLLSLFQGESILVLIGPEGGFDPIELQLASKGGVMFVSLGDNILKSDTAAIATIAMINYALSDV